jgi:hypothetical protein
MGGHWIGVEQIPELLHRAREAGFEVSSSVAEVSKVIAGNGQLDLLVAFDVVEHLDVGTIRRFLADAKTALKPSGLLIFRIPSGDSPFVGSIYYGDLTHRTLLGSGAVRQLAAEAAFDVHQIRGPAVPIYGLGIRRALRRVVSHVAENLIFGFVRKVLIRNPGAVLNPDMLVVLTNKHSTADHTSNRGAVRTVPADPALNESARN